MRLSRVRTTQPFLPASASQTSSGVPLGKWSVRRWTVAPASRRALTTERLSSDSSTKNVTGSSGFEVDFAADRVPDRFFACTVVPRQVRRLVARFETLREHRGRNAGARDDRPAERNARMDHHRARLFFRRLRTHERVELDRHPLRIALDPLQIGVDEIGHLDLAGLRKIDDLAHTLDEKLGAVRGELLFEQRPVRAEFLDEEAQSAPDRR